MSLLEITVYGRPKCGQCTATRGHLQELEEET